MSDQEKEMVKELIAGKKKSLRVFYKRYYPKLLVYVQTRVKTKEDAEEIVQDTFLSFLDSLPLFQHRSSLLTFLVSIARHEIADYFRRLYAKKALKYVPFVDQVYTEPLYSSGETRELFEQALAELSHEEQQLVLWKYDQQLSVKEMADKLGLSVKATESRLFRARQAFKVAYAEVEGD